jgi:hypothetical protein
MDHAQTYEFVRNFTEELTGWLRIEDFSRFLIYTFNQGNAPNPLAALGLGQDARRIIYYNEEHNYYYVTIAFGAKTVDTLIVYCPHEQETDLITKPDHAIFTKYLTRVEREILIKPQFKLINPRVLHFFGEDSGAAGPSLKFCPYEIYSSFRDFLVALDFPEYVWHCEREEGPDLLFLMQGSFIPDGSEKSRVICVVDEEKVCRGKKYLHINEDLNISVLEELGDVSPGTLFNTRYTYLVPVNSFQPPA